MRYEHLQAKPGLMIDILGRRFDISSSDGAFHLWAKAPPSMSGDQFVDLAIKNNMLIIPGSVRKVKNSHYRLCYTVPDEKLKVGAELLCRLATE